MGVVFLIDEVCIDRVALLARILARSPYANDVSNWANTLMRYVDFLQEVESKVGEDDMQRLVDMGADFWTMRPHIMRS